MKIKLWFFFCLFLWLFARPAIAQDRFTTLDNTLTALSKDVPGLNEKVELSVNNVSIQEFIRGLAAAHNLNVSVDPNLRLSIINNFSNATVADVFLFLCRQYDLDITLIGNIMSIAKYTPPAKEAEAYKPRVLKISYNPQTDFLTLDLKKDSLFEVVKEITRKSMKNVVLSPDIQDKLVSVFIQNRPFLNTLQKLAFANDLKVTPTDDNFYLIEKQQPEGKTAQGKEQKISPKIPSEGLDIRVEKDESVTVNANNVALKDVIIAVTSEMLKNYFLFTDIKGNATFYVENAAYEDFLNYVFNGTEYTFKKQDNVYLIGERKLEGLRTTELVQLQYRTVEKIKDNIPADLKQGVDIQEFIELNSLIMSGSLPRINEIKQFVRDIDRVVPVIVIDVMIVDSKKTKTKTTGIEAGLSQEAKETGGTIFPKLDITLSSSSLNELIESFNGFGLVNLGKVTPNFYLSLKLLEENGFLDMRSTPKLATINGHEANLSIGKTEYYLETSNNVIGTQNPQNIITQQYKSVNADLTVTIKPIVSGDDYVTLEITVEQSDFTVRISPNAPPGSVKRKFKSLIRVKNEEMVLLGGLEEMKTDDTGSGVPFLSRIPVIKWLFSSRTRVKNNAKLNIFIKPTVIY
ncbi:MAG: hypothetical protein HYY40_11880 [Bacteroidetes bacterium]|nr:hypothetical protein [Bacteroidota bacterium]